MSSGDRRVLAGGTLGVKVGNSKSSELSNNEERERERGSIKFAEPFTQDQISTSTSVETGSLAPGPW